MDCVTETEATYTGSDTYTEVLACDDDSLVLEPVMEFGPDECASGELV